MGLQESTDTVSHCHSGVNRTAGDTDEPLLSNNLTERDSAAFPWFSRFWSGFAVSQLGYSVAKSELRRQRSHLARCPSVFD